MFNWRRFFVIWGLGVLIAAGLDFIILTVDNRTLSPLVVTSFIFFWMVISAAVNKKEE